MLLLICILSGEVYCLGRGQIDLVAFSRKVYRKPLDVFVHRYQHPINCFRSSPVATEIPGPALCNSNEHMEVVSLSVILLHLLFVKSRLNHP